MADIFHMYPYLVSTAGFQHTLYQGYITKPFQHPVVSDSLFSMIAIGVGLK